MALALGCAPSAQRSLAAPAQGKPAPPAPKPGEPVRPALPAAEDAGAAVSLEPVPAKPLVAASFGVVEPRQGAFVPASEAQVLRVSVQGAEGELWIALDEHPFRSVRTGSVRLGALLLEDEELAPGPHRVVVLKETEGGWAFAASSFSVGDEGQAASPPPVPPPSGVVLLDPRGTYNGVSAADAVTVRAWSLTSRAALSVRVTGTKLLLEKRTNGEALRVVGLPSGDFRFEVLELAPAADGRLVHAGGRWSNMSRVITVNRDAPVPSSSAAPAPSPAAAPAPLAPTSPGKGPSP